MRIPWRIAEVLDDLNFTPIARKTGIHFGPDVSFANWGDVAALGGRLVELGQKLQDQAKEAENPVCVGMGAESCWRPRLVLVWVNPTRYMLGVSDIIGILKCGDLEATGVWHWVNNQKEFVIPVIPEDLENRGSWDSKGFFTTHSKCLMFHLSTPGEIRRG